MKELCIERNNLYEKQNDMKGQKQKIEKLLERKEMRGIVVAMSLFYVVNEEWKWYNQVNKS